MISQRKLIEFWTTFAARERIFYLMRPARLLLHVAPEQAFRNDSKERNERGTIPFFFNDSFFSKRNWTERGTRPNLGLHVQFLFYICSCNFPPLIWIVSLPHFSFSTARSTDHREGKMCEREWQVKCTPTPTVPLPLTVARLTNSLFCHWFYAILLQYWIIWYVIIIIFT